jgi:hypothetical protein
VVPRGNGLKVPVSCPDEGEEPETAEEGVGPAHVVTPLREAPVVAVRASGSIPISSSDLLAERTVVLANNVEVGALSFEGQGGDLFGTLLGGYLLTVITLGLYMPGSTSTCSASTPRPSRSRSRARPGARTSGVRAASSSGRRSSATSWRL